MSADAPILIQPLAALRLLQLTSPTLPIGAFTYSQGMEYAREVEWLQSAQDVEYWLQDVIHDNLQYVDLPLIHHMMQALENQNHRAFFDLSQLVLACRESSELLAEERQRGQALYQVLRQLPELEQDFLCQNPALQSVFLALFAYACWQFKVPAHAALYFYGFSVLENLIGVAIKVVPLGQSAGQDLLFRLNGALTAIIRRAQHIGTDEIGAGNVALGIASSNHESQYCRLFRS